MAGDWIKMRSDLFTHPKVVRISSALKADTLRTVGGLMSVWCLFDAHSEDGRLEGYTPEVLDAHLRWDGFADAMIAVGWLVYDASQSLVLPRFDAHNGQSSKRRAQDADRKREVRKVSASEPDKKRTREEKRREEYSVTDVTGGAAAKTAEDLTKDELWSAGKSLLSTVMPEKQCGSFVGKLVKDYGDAVVVEAVRAAVVTRPADPAEYLKATCQRAAGKRQPINKQEALEQRNRQVAAEWAAEGA